MLDICTDAACNNATTIGDVVSLGTVTVGQTANVFIEWLKANKDFYFSRDSFAYGGPVSCTQSDASPPSNPFRSLRLRFDVPQCVGEAPIEGSIAASFDDVLVNRNPPR